MRCKEKQQYVIMHLGHHVRDTHTRQFTFSSVDFVKNKTKRIKRKIYKSVPPNVRPCRMLGAASLFHLRHRPSQHLMFFIWHCGKTNNPKIRWSKIYLNSLLSKTRKCSNVVNQVKIKRGKSNDQIQVKY